MVITINIKEYLLDWILDYLKNKDLIHQKIVEIATHKDAYDVVIKYKDRTQNVIILPRLQDISSVKHMFNGEHILLVTLNNRDNLNITFDHWNELITYKHLCMYFINPFSSIEKKWIIYPYTHHKICDASSLKQGLRAMFETVEEITEEELIKHICSIS